MPGPADFLRHIVNKVLAESKASWQVSSDVKKFIGRAEDKYKFSSYGGDPARLADYLRSRDFDDVLHILKSSGLLSLAERMLERVIEEYKDYPEVVEAARKRLEQIRSGEFAGKTATDLAQIIHSEAPPSATVVEEGDAIRIRQNGKEVVVKKMNGKYLVTYRLFGEEEVKGLDELRMKLRKIFVFSP